MPVVYRRDDRGIVGVESFGAEGLAFVVIHTVLDALPSRMVLGLWRCSSCAISKSWGFLVEDVGHQRLTRRRKVIALQ
jgi:hypothetical protein